MSQQDQEAQARTPHQRAMDRHEAALDTLRDTEKRAAEMVSFAGREVGEALSELKRYERQPGVALPVAEQRRIEDLMALTRRRLAEIRGEDR